MAYFNCPNNTLFGGGDACTVVSTTLSDVFTYRTGGVTGTAVATVTVVYVDAQKDTISTVTVT